MKKIIPLALLLTGILPAFLLAQKNITFPESSFRNTHAKDFSAKNLTSKYYNELWTYHINLDNGVQIIYSFSINDFGSFKGRVTGAKLLVSWKDGNTYVANKEYDVQDLINKPENRYLRLHPDRPYWAKGNFDEEHVLNFQNERDGILYDLNLTLYDISKGKTLGDGVYKVGDNEIGMLLLIPHAKVKGFIALNGDTLKANGTAYMDHIYQNNLSTELIDKSYRVKSGNDKNGFFFHFITLKNGKKNVPIGYGVRYKEGNETLLTPSKINPVNTTKVRGIELDKYLMIKPFQMDSLNLVVDKHLHTYSIMDELGGIQKFFAKRVIGGELIEMNGTVTINNDKKGYFYYMATDS